MDAMIFGIQKIKPDLVITGINPEPNIAFDIFLSADGSAGAYAASKGIPAIVVSLGEMVPSKKTYKKAVEITKSLVDLVLKAKLPKGSFLNVVVPSNPKGVRFSHHRSFDFGDRFIPFINPRGKKLWWLSYEKKRRITKTPEVKDSEVYTVGEGYISIAPLSVHLFDEETTLKLWEALNK